MRKPTRKQLTITVIAILIAIMALMLLRQPATSTSITDLAKSQPTKAQTLSEKLIPETDLPPPGTRSLFDHLIVQNDGLPYPFEKLIALLQKQHPEGQAPVSLLIPHGRSLLKGQADDARPRIVVAADYQTGNTPVALGTAPQGQLFLGHLPSGRHPHFFATSVERNQRSASHGQRHCRCPWQQALSQRSGSSAAVHA